MAYKILAYLAERPRAQDTLDGIFRWWVLERWTERQRMAAQQAVDDLVGAGFLIATRGRDDRWRYRLDHHRLAEVQRLVAAWDREQEAGR